MGHTLPAPSLLKATASSKSLTHQVIVLSLFNKKMIPFAFRITVI